MDYSFVLKRHTLTVVMVLAVWIGLDEKNLYAAHTSGCPNSLEPGNTCCEKSDRIAPTCKGGTISQSTRPKTLKPGQTLPTDLGRCGEGDTFYSCAATTATTSPGVLPLAPPGGPGGPGVPPLAPPGGPSGTTGTGGSYGGGSASYGQQSFQDRRGAVHYTAGEVRIDPRRRDDDDTSSIASGTSRLGPSASSVGGSPPPPLAVGGGGVGRPPGGGPAGGGSSSSIVSGSSALSGGSSASSSSAPPPGLPGGQGALSPAGTSPSIVPLPPAPPPPTGGAPPPPPAPPPPTGSATVSYTPTGVQRNGSYNYRRYGNSDLCPISAQIDGGMGCNTTHTTVEAARMSNVMSQTMGASATQIMGAQGQAAAYNGGTQSSALEAAANMQDTTGKMQVGVGAGNLALGAIQMYQAYKHSQHGKNVQAELQGATLSYKEVNATGSNAGVSNDGRAPGQAGYVSSSKPGGLAEKALQKFKVNEHSEVPLTALPANLDPNTNPKVSVSGTPEYKAFEAWKKDRNHQGEARQNDAVSSLHDISADSTSEQNRAKGTAMMGGLMSMVTGAQQTASGAFSIAAAQRLKDAANALKNPQGKDVPYMLAPALGPGAPAQTSGQAPSITGSGIDPNAAEAPAELDAAGTPPDLGSGVNPNPLGSGVPGGPAAGKFNPGTGGTGGGGGGEGGGGGGSTSAAQSTPEEAQPKLAPNEKGTLYDSGGAFSSGGGGAGKGAEGGPDLSGLLEKFLPKKDDPQPQNGIMQFGNPSAQGEQPFSVLGKEVNIFSRIHETYVDMNKRGKI